MQRKSYNRLFSVLVGLVHVFMMPTLVFGQTSIGIGQWRTHYPYASTHSVVEVNHKIYAASQVAFYYYDESDQSIHTISKKDGLTGTDITKLGAYKAKEVLVGYADGNIDFVKDDQIDQFDDIQRSSLEGSKTIRHFWIENDQALVSTDYGLSVINLIKKEVADSYINISSDGTANPFYGSVLSSDGDSIFVVSQKGVMSAKYSSGVNLKDYSNWKLYGVANGLPTGVNRAIGRLGNTIYVGVNDQGLYYFNGTAWQASSITGTTGFELRSIVSNKNNMMVCADDKIFRVYNATSNMLYAGGNISNPNEAVWMPNDEIWVSTKTFGLVHYIAGETYETRPGGPYTTAVYRLKYLNNKVVVCPGGLGTAFGPLYIDGGFMFHSSDEWKNYNRFETFPDNRDVLDATYQTSRSKWYFSTFGYGLVEWDGQTFKVYNTGNSLLQSNQVTGLATSSDGTTWVGNTSMNSGDPFLFAINKSGTWKAYYPFQNTGRYPLEIIVDQNSKKWIRLATAGGIRGLMVFDETINSQIYLTTSNGAGSLPSNNVNTVDEDKNGQIWIGMDTGIGIFANPAQIKSGSVPNIYLPIVDGFPLFFDKKINCIKTDGGNRKWVGTPDGAFLLSADGLETIHHFNTTNSPLTNDNIMAITIDEKLGEVFFGTDNGIVSYRSDATAGTSSHEDVKVFPDPVLANFEGEVGISGLANNARVKITDTAGKLIFETRANGATATWNVKNYNGRRAAAGVYLIFSASEDGAEKFVGKIAVLE